MVKFVIHIEIYPRISLDSLVSKEARKSWLVMNFY
jgi:hypothetical protein